MKNFMAKLDANQAILSALKLVKSKLGQKEQSLFVYTVKPGLQRPPLGLAKNWSQGGGWSLNRGSLISV